MVAQLLWRRHRDLVAGLVLCSTARNVTGSPVERVLAMAMPWAVVTASWFAPFSPVGTDAIAGPLLDASLAAAQRRAALAHMRRVPLATALDAMRAACAFSSHLWIGGVDVPTAVLVTRHDRIVAPQRQRKLAAAVPGAVVVEIDGDHGVFLADPEGFVRRAATGVCRRHPAGGTHVDARRPEGAPNGGVPSPPGPDQYGRFCHIVVARLTPASIPKGGPCPDFPPPTPATPSSTTAAPPRSRGTATMIVDALPLRPGDTVIDAGCGTGLCFAAVQERIGPEGMLVGRGRGTGDARASPPSASPPPAGRTSCSPARPLETAELPTADHALFCAVHDIMQSGPALDNVLGHLRPGASVAAGGGKWGPVWAIGLNASVLALHAPYVRDFAGFDRPWTHLAERVPDLAVQEVAMGAGYVASGRRHATSAALRRR